MPVGKAHLRRFFISPLKKISPQGKTLAGKRSVRRRKAKDKGSVQSV